MASGPTLEQSVARLPQVSSSTAVRSASVGIYGQAQDLVAADITPSDPVAQRQQSQPLVVLQSLPSLLFRAMVAEG